MSKWICAVALGAAMAAVGCQNDNGGRNRDRDMNTSSNEPKRMSADACTHCAGVQTATADGKCPECGMKAK
ncbi:MAG TPA: hypothetical protein VF669_15120 [Tepidisphaeraceae bacterium]|jgi:hypothetical protein